MSDVQHNIPPLPIGTEYKGNCIVAVVQADPYDPDRPYLYKFDNDEHEWLPAKEYAKTLRPRRTLQ